MAQYRLAINFYYTNPRRYLGHGYTHEVAPEEKKKMSANRAKLKSRKALASLLVELTSKGFTV
jgi:hypothetical protein